MTTIRKEPQKRVAYKISRDVAVHLNTVREAFFCDSNNEAIAAMLLMMKLGEKDNLPPVKQITIDMMRRHIDIEHNKGFFSLLASMFQEEARRVKEKEIDKEVENDTNDQ